MAFWLVKSEPATYSWDNFVKDKRTIWDGVRNYAARNHLKAMKKGDQVFFYHSNEGVEIVGIAEVVKEYFQDPTSTETAWVSVEIRPLKALKNPVSLVQIKKEAGLSDMALVKLSRLSVQPVTLKEWETVLKMAGEK